MGSADGGEIGQTSSGGQPDAGRLQAALVDQLKGSGVIVSHPVEAAFRAVPRHLFLPGVPLEQVYRDEAIPTKREHGIPISSSSQPAIMAIMLEQLDLRPGQRVLEIGAATGYNAALLGAIVGERGRVVTLDIDEDLAAGARAHLAAAGVDNVAVECGDGGFGWPDAAPYDRIIATVGAWEIAPAWREQLTPDGRLVVPLSLRTVQKSVALQMRDGYMESVSVRDCGFMPLRGAFAGPASAIPLGPEPGLMLMTENPTIAPAETIHALLSSAGHDYPTHSAVTTREVWSLLLWLALHEPSFAQLSADDTAAESGPLPFLLGFGGPDNQYMTAGLLGPTSLAVLTRPDPSDPSDPSGPIGECDDTDAAPLGVRRFGTPNELAERLIEQVEAWEHAGRPTTEQLQLSIYPSPASAPPADGIAIAKRWSTMIATWARHS